MEDIFEEYMLHNASEDEEFGYTNCNDLSMRKFAEADTYGWKTNKRGTWYKIPAFEYNTEEGRVVSTGCGCTMFLVNNSKVRDVWYA